MAIVYPPGQISLLGIKNALQNVEPHIAYKGWDGTIFHLSGPLAPVLGAQRGVALQGIWGVGGKFTHIKNQGARQDGATWQDAPYDETEIDFSVEASGITGADYRGVVRAWINSWDVKRPGLLSWFTPEMGEWWCDVRLAKAIPDHLRGAWGARQTFTWTAVNFDAFWRSFDSVSRFSAAQVISSDDFERTNSTDLGTAWKQTYTGTGGVCATPDGHNVSQTDVGGSIRNVVNIRQDFTAATDCVIVTEQHTSFMEAPIGGAAYNDVWARCSRNPDGTWGGDGIRCRFAWDFVEVSSFVGGVETVIGSTPTLFFGLSAPAVSMACGTSANLRSYIPMINGIPVATFTETGAASKVGPGYRGAGFGMESGTRTGGGETTPSTVGYWVAYDNLNVAQRGFCPLTNIGSQDAWPRYLCYAGTGTNTPTFRFGDGPGGNLLSFGPLEPGQVVLVTTMPRLRSIIDLTPTAPLPQQLEFWQILIKDLISFATINDVPPLLQQFESWFGILPPQGVLYSLLNGRFTKPIPGKAEGIPPVESHIPVEIENGNPDSKVVAAITPLRTWPE